MGSVIGNLLAFVVAISVLVAVHEYGHSLGLGHSTVTGPLLSRMSIASRASASKGATSIDSRASSAARRLRKMGPSRSRTSRW